MIRYNSSQLYIRVSRELCNELYRNYRPRATRITRLRCCFHACMHFNYWHRPLLPLSVPVPLSLSFQICATSPKIAVVLAPTDTTLQYRVSPPTHKRGIVAGIRPQQVRQQSPVLGLHASLQRSNVRHGSEPGGNSSVNAEQASCQTHTGHPFVIRRTPYGTHENEKDILRSI